MTEHEAAIWLAKWGVGIVVGLYATHRLLLWLEARGWVYYRNSEPKPGGETAAALEMERMIRPSVEHHIAAEDAQVESQEDDGE